MKIHVWVPDYASAIGGIQTFSRFLVRGLRDIFPKARITVLSKNDTSYPESSAEWDAFIPLGWWPNKLRTAAFSAQLFRSALRERPNLVVTTHVNFSPVAYGLQKLFTTPYIAVGHGIEVWEIADRKLRRALRQAAKLVAVSEFTKQRMASALQISSDAIAVLPNTFDPEKFTPAPKPRVLLKRYGLQSDQPIILTISRLASVERYKGYDQILRALPLVRERVPDVRYVLGGRGPDRPRIESLIQELGLQNNVILAGYVAEHELREHYNLCDVFAMPSKGEGFGIVFLEALGCGKPVIAGNKDGSVDALLDGELGVLIDPDDVTQIADTLIAILRRKSEVRSHMSVARQPRGNDAEDSIPEIVFDPEALRRRVIEAYGYDTFKQGLSEILEPLLKDKVEGRK